MILFVGFSLLVIAATASIAAVLAGGGTTELVIALAIHFTGTVLAIVLTLMALNTDID